MFALYAAPAVNLFEKTTDRIPVRINEHEYHVVPDRSRMLDFEPAAILNPYDHYGTYLVLALQRPTTYQLVSWLMNRRGTRLPARRDGLTDGRWVVTGDDRFARDDGEALRWDGGAQRIGAARHALAAGAVAGHDLIGLKRLQETSHLPQFVRQSAAQMKTANQRVNMFDAGDALAMAHDIHQPAMAAAGNNYQTSV